MDETSLDDAGRVERIYQRAFARSPTPEELARSLRYLAVNEELREERWTSFCQVVFASGEFQLLR